MIRRILLTLALWYERIKSSLHLMRHETHKQSIKLCLLNDLHDFANDHVASIRLLLAESFIGYFKG